MLAVTYKYTLNCKYFNSMMELGLKNEYFDNIKNWRVTYPQTTNIIYSDDELGYLALAAFFYVKDAFIMHI